MLAANQLDNALEVYRTGVSTLPENRVLQVELGNALLRAGKKEEAVSTVKSAMAGSSDAKVLNEGAYALLRVGSSELLPLAETSAREAAETLETESAGIAIEGVNAEAFRRANLLLETWDTLGWAYFTEGKYALGEEYVRASWRNAAHAEEGLHMGEILERKGDFVGATRVYEMALSRTGSGGGASVAAELHARVDGLKEKGVEAPDPHPDLALQEQRISICHDRLG